MSSSTAPDHDHDQTADLLRRFQMSRDAAAFREIVQRFGGLVEGTAGRFLQGDMESARDVAQRVFVDLAQAAPRLSPDSQLGGWLHRHTVFVASHHCQADRRRRHRELEASFRFSLDKDDSLLPDDGRAAAVHEALNRLPQADRAVLVLRFWENRPLREIGAALGIGEDAAQKRVTRALERLRGRLGGKAALASAASLAAWLSPPAVGNAGAAAAAPAWTAAVTKAALTAAPLPVGGGIFSALGISWKAALSGALAVALVAVPLLLYQQNALQEARSQLAQARSASVSARPARDAATGGGAQNPHPVRNGASSSVTAGLEERIRRLEAQLLTKSAREVMVNDNLKRARSRADRDREVYSPDEMTELEAAYQLAKQEPDAERHAAALQPLFEKFGSSNRAGCAMLRLARLSSGEQREQWLREAISHHSDAYFLDGSSVGALARIYLAAELDQTGRTTEADTLRQEITDLFPDATDHDGLPLMESLHSGSRPE